MIQRSPELEALARLDDPAVADRSRRHRHWISGSIMLVAGAMASYFVIGNQALQRDMPGAEEEFSTTTFRPPPFTRDGEHEPPQAKPEIVQLPPPPPPPVKDEKVADAVQFKVPPPPPQAPQHDTAPEPAEEQFPKRYRSNMIVFDNTGPNDTHRASEPRDGQASTVAGEDRNSRFLAAASGLAERSVKARKIERIDALIAEGTLIPGTLETAIVSDLPGQVRAIVSQDVRSFDGRRVLIPMGTRLIGEYQSGVIRGQRRIFVIWTRMLRDDGVSVRLDSIGADSLGRAGLAGQVENKFAERFSSAILLSVVGGGVSYLTGQDNQARQNGNDGGQRAGDLARSSLAQTFSDMANQTLGDSLKIAPTISVAQGERIFVYARQDLDFSSVYDDPVSEALKEIRDERDLN